MCKSDMKLIIQATNNLHTQHKATQLINTQSVGNFIHIWPITCIQKVQCTCYTALIFLPKLTCDRQPMSCQPTESNSCQ